MKTNKNFVLSYFLNQNRIKFQITFILLNSIYPKLELGRSKIENNVSQLLSGGIKQYIF